jgi:argininosuccinate lyase
MKGLPFREAHGVVGAAVRLCLKRDRSLADLSLDEWRSLSDLFDDGVLLLFDVGRALRRRELPGGPGPRAVGRAIVRAGVLVAATRRSVTPAAGGSGPTKRVGAGARRAR